MKLVTLIKMCLNETYSKIHICKHLFDKFHTQNGLKQEDALSPLLFNFALEYVNLLGDDRDTIKKNTGTLIDASKEVGQEVNAEKSKYMLLSRHQNARQNHDIKIGNRSYENVEKFKYLGTTVTFQNLIHERIKSR
jgi:hypothetical protein